MSGAFIITLLVFTFLLNFTFDNPVLCFAYLWMRNTYIQQTTSQKGNETFFILSRSGSCILVDIVVNWVIWSTSCTLKSDPYQCLRKNEIKKELINNIEWFNNFNFNLSIWVVCSKMCCIIDAEEFHYFKIIH